MFTAKERAAITAEQQKHDDLLLLRAHDGVAASAAAHGGRAVAEKALAWYIHSATHTRADYVAKVDDDSMVNLPRLVAELRAVTATAPRPEHAHFGVHVYRVWNWGRQAKVPNAACGEHSDNGPPAGRGVLRQMNASVKEGGKCAGAMGPFPFLDGSFEVLGKGVLTTIFGAARVRAFASTEFERPRPPYWSHEDAGLGALIHREVSERNLPMTYVALRRWQHNLFWLNWADLSTLVDGDVLWSHYTRSAERSDYVGGASPRWRSCRRTASTAATPRRVGLAGGELGLHLLHEAEAGAPAGGDALAAQEVRERGRDQPHVRLRSHRDAARGRTEDAPPRDRHEEQRGRRAVRAARGDARA